MQKDGVSIIVSGDSKFQLHNYKSEEELENLAMKHSKEIFGEDVIYIDSKKKMTSKEGISGIPDGFLLDFKHNKFYIVEVELSTHDIVGHISNQIIRFKIAMNNGDTHAQLANEFYDKILRERLKSNASLQEIQNIINNKFSIAILIDSVSGKLSEVVNVLSQDGTEVLAIPFETYADSKGNYLHKFTTFTKEALEKEAKKWTFKWTTVPVEEHLDKTDSGLKGVFSTLRKQICSLPDVMEKSRKNWITYQTSPLKNFCTIKILPDCLEVHIKCDTSFRDDEGITKKIKRTSSWTFDRVFTVRVQDDIEDAMHFIRQSYECTCGR